MQMEPAATPSARRAAVHARRPGFPCDLSAGGWLGATRSHGKRPAQDFPDASDDDSSFPSKDTEEEEEEEESQESEDETAEEDAIPRPPSPARKRARAAETPSAPVGDKRARASANAPPPPPATTRSVVG